MTTPARRKWHIATAEEIVAGATVAVSVPQRIDAQWNDIIPCKVLSPTLDAKGQVEGAELLYYTQEGKLEVIELPLVVLRILK